MQEHLTEVLPNNIGENENYIFKFLSEMIKYRLDKEFGEGILLKPTFLSHKKETYIDSFIKEHDLSLEDTVILLLALIPHVSPSFINDIIVSFLPSGGEFPEFGGVKGKNHRGILPTVETALYILYGNSFQNRLEGMSYVINDSFVLNNGIVDIERVPSGEPEMSGKLLIDDEYKTLLLFGEEIKPELSPSFPASLIDTTLGWDDLVLKLSTLQEVKEIEAWLQCNETLLNEWNMHGKIKPGYRVLFWGPPGTGKTLTAGLLGKYTKRDVYRVDLSMVVSKYIGETEKNLSKLFDKAENKDWILFFDEADAIFGKRTNVRDAHDKYANQEVSYLLQRIEGHAGLVILASNFKNNIDTAFTRRFNSIIEFEAPSYEERIKLWEKSLPKGIEVEESVSIPELAKKYGITGANIINIVQYACLKTIHGNHKTIQKEFILEGIRREYGKEGKTIRI
ncbi:ATPase family associated with various cellular activities (AAA) [Tenacibaculum sp. MAR_2009_124]|uniref:ATP-binding protein n=1 Tax=Tenacibaculum sp. MAR_2009_124 TaxID=1250059 RepID=UPI0008956A43|nr:ATP-binding protein [Tenacibaculum sp. MAR_2009_124]SEC20735.1 ATPase family associated with various cellular activities (AAA) [Tenacibaculum sp. MAR_2009_124]